MSRLEFLTPEGYRIDGRKAEEIRHLQCRIGGLSSKADGSAMVQLGCTKVVSYVYGPSESSRYPSHPERAEVHCTFSSAAFRGSVRRSRRFADRQSIANASTIRDVFVSVILTEKHPKSHIHIFICVLEDDGGVLPTAINATTLALIDAGIPLRDFVSSASVGLLGQSNPLVDINDTESSSAGAELSLAIHSRTEETTSLNLDSKIPIDQFDEMHRLAVVACREIARMMKNSVREHFTELFLKT